jgi:O-antigen/teichoic acid export membrane protein
MSEIRSRTVRGLAWTGAGRLGQQVIQFGITVALARLLVPADFGLVGLILVFTGFASVFVDVGLSGAVIQRRELTERHLSTAFWLNVAAGIALSGIVAGLSPLIAAFYGDPSLVALTLAMSANFAVAGVGLVPRALIQRSMNFRRLTFIETAAAAVAGIAAVLGAFAGLGVWSLIMLTLITTFLTTVSLWFATRWRPSRIIDRAALRDLWGFSGGVLGFQTINYWARNFDNLLVGKVLGSAPLGIYSRAYNIMLVPISQVNQVTTRVMFPALSRLHEDPQRVKRAYLRAVGLIALFTFPAAVGLFVAAEPFVLTLYGPNWSEMILILQILCIPALLQSIGTTTGWIYQSQGRTDWLFRWGAATGVLTIASFAVGIAWGLVGVAVAYAVRTLMLVYLNYAVPGRLIGLTFWDVARRVRGVLVAALTMGIVVWLVGRELPDGWSWGERLILETGVGVLYYVAIVRLTSLSPYVDLMDLVRRRRSDGKDAGPGGLANARV